MQQLEIQFFWPLTEQIPLDLNYTDCEKPKYNVNQSLESFTFANLNLTTSFTIDDNVTIRTKKINWFGRLLYRMMGLKWEQKI